VNRDYHHWYSPSIGRDMHLRWYGRSGARLIAFPTSLGTHNEWPNRHMPEVLGDFIERGDLQLWCIDHNHDDSWYNKRIHPGERAWRHLKYDQYLRDELLPFTAHVNGNPFVIAAGASFGAYHAMCFGLRNPHLVHRIIGMSGLYDITSMTDGYMDDTVHRCNPATFMRHEHDPARMEAFRRQDIIMAIGATDSHVEGNRSFSGTLWERGIGNALRIWDGWAHDWPYWESMIRKYVGGHD
jgi:esterase/lipase superfamily enzyme